jgi:restriction system protein
MTVPSFQEFMLPVLRVLSDGEVHQFRALLEEVAQMLLLTQEDRAELVGSGKKFRFEDRTLWAGTYLRQAGLIANAARGHWYITEAGKVLLSQQPARVDVAMLEAYPAFQAFKARRKSTSDTFRETELHDSPQTPEELIEQGYDVARRSLASDLHQRVMDSPPAFFEQLVVDLLVSMGYGGSRIDAGRAIGRSGDGGVDGVIDEDRLGLDNIYIQAKRWRDNVSSNTVNEFVGSVLQRGARKGVIITTSQFTPTAKAAATGPHGLKIVLIDGQKLTDLMIDFGVGVTEKANYVLKKVDEEYFAGE